jgi:hypothetical protein
MGRFRRWVVYNATGIVLTIPVPWRLVLMKFTKKFLRGLLFLVMIVALCGGMAVPFLAPVQAAPVMQVGTNIIISEFQTRGLGGVNDEFIELYNPTALAIDISGWTIRKSSGCGAVTDVLATIGASVSLNPGQHYLAAGFLFSGTAIPDFRNPSNWAIDDNGGIAIFDSGGVLVDQVGMCNTTLFVDGTSLSPLSGTTDQSYDRKSDVSGSCVDSNNNGSDFFLRVTSDPQSSSSPITSCGNPTPTPTNTATSTSTPTNTPTNTITNTPTTLAANIVISEFRFRGSAGASDEFVELFNPTSGPINLNGWKLRGSNNAGTVSDRYTFIADVILGPGKHYLLANTSNVDGVTADATYSTGITSDGGVALTLSNNTIIDAVGLSSGSAFKEGTPLAQLTTDADRSYDRKSGALGNCLDSGNNFLDFFLRNPSDPQNFASPVTICGNPTPTPPPSTATRKPTATRTLPPPPPPELVAINEFVPRPGRDWNNDGVINTGDEFIEIINHGTISVNLGGYSLDDEVNLGSGIYSLPSVTLSPGQRIVFYGSQTNILLSDGGDGVRLLKPNGQLMDAFNYTVVNFPDQSFCRLPDNGGLDDWNKNCFPTPGLRNSRGGNGSSSLGGDGQEPLCPIADTLPQGFFLAECNPFGLTIWNRPYWDDTGWFGEQELPDNPGTFVD